MPVYSLTIVHYLTLKSVLGQGFYEGSCTKYIFMHTMSWKKTSPLLAEGINLPGINCISQQFALYVSCVTCCRLAVVSHFSFHCSRISAWQNMSPCILFPLETYTQRSTNSRHCCDLDRADLHLS